MAIALKHPVVHAHAGHAKPVPRPHHRGRKVAITLLSVVVALAVAGLVATVVITRTINHRLATLPGYAGHVEKVRVAWWRGGITVRNLQLFMRGHEQDGPVLRLDLATVSLTRGALLRGKLGLRGVFDGAEVNVLKTEKSEDKPPKTDEEKEQAKQKRLAEVQKWQAELTKAFPLELTRIEVTNSRVRFVDSTVEPHPEMAVEHLHVVLTGLGQKPSTPDELPAEAELTGVMTGNGRLVVKAQADPLSPQPRFQAHAEVTGLELVPIANFLRSVAKIEVMAGTFEVYMEATAAGGHYEGYVKPFFRDLKFKPAPDETVSPLKRLATSAAAAVTSLLKNDEQKVATKAPFQGNFADNKVDVWTTIDNLFRNAFVESLREGLEGQRPTR